MAQKPIRKDRLKNRAAILDAAAHIFATEGYSVPLDRIADEANVGRATLYRNFANRSELALAIFEQNVNEFEALGHSMAETPGGFRRMFLALAESIAAHAGLGQAFSSLEGADVLMPLRDRTLDVLDRYRVAGVAAGEIRPDVTREDILMIISTLGMGLALGNLDQRQALAARMIELIFTGLSTPSI